MVALKNLSNSERGRWAEDVVIDFIIFKKWKILSKRTKYKFGEIDLIAERDDQVALIEVKFLHQSWMSFERISKAQICRLQKNHMHLSATEFKNKELKLFLAFVDKNKKIEWIDLMGNI